MIRECSLYSFFLCFSHEWQSTIRECSLFSFFIYFFTWMTKCDERVFFVFFLSLFFTWMTKYDKRVFFVFFLSLFFTCMTKYDKRVFFVFFLYLFFHMNDKVRWESVLCILSFFVFSHERQSAIRECSLYFFFLSFFTWMTKCDNKRVFFVFFLSLFFHMNDKVR